MHVRALTYNIHWGVGTDGVYSLSRIAQVIRSCHADIVAMQEVHEHTSKHPESQTQELARLCSMPYFRFEPTVVGHPHGLTNDQIGFYGNAVLSRWPLQEMASTMFDAPGYSRSQEPRGAMACVVKAPVPFVVANTHLGCDITGYEQSAAVPQLLHFLHTSYSHHSNIVLCGDFNACAQRECVQNVRSQGWTDAWLDAAAKKGCTYLEGCTMPTYLPLTRIDYIFVKGSWQVQDAVTTPPPSVTDAVDAVPPAPSVTVASDHFPVLAILVL